MPQSRRRAYAGLFILMTLVVLIGGIAFLIPSPTSHMGGKLNPPIQRLEAPPAESSMSNESKGAYPVKKLNSSTQSNDEFYGKIENVPFKGQTTGIVKADTNCRQVEAGLTNCIAIIIAADGTELHFNYKHDMTEQGCLSSGNKVSITLLNTGIIKVVRG